MFWRSWFSCFRAHTLIFPSIHYTTKKKVFEESPLQYLGQTHYKMISCNIWLPVVIHRSKTRNNALDVFWGIETIIVNLAFSWVLVKLQFQLMKVKNISPKLSARANYTFSGMTILQHEPAAAPKKVFLPCVSLPRANFYENIFYNAFALGTDLTYFIVSYKKSLK